MLALVDQWKRSVFLTGCNFLVLFAILGLPTAAFAAVEPSPKEESKGFSIDIDATEMHRHLLISEITMPVKKGQQVLWYPEWVPGVAGATGQIANAAGVVFTDEKGDALTWRRDPTHLNRFIVTIPKDVHRLRARLTYIANQPTPQSTSVDSYGTKDLLVINFNTCILYPENIDIFSTPYALRVKAPVGWGTGSALQPISSSQTGWTDFGDVPLRQIMDSPLIAGKHYREVHLSVEGEGIPPTTMHVIGDHKGSTQISTKRIRQMAQIMREACSLFGQAPFKEYAFLVICSDRLPRFGLEHANCSLNSIRTMALRDIDLYRNRPAYLFSHELIHAWCGKHRVPEGMLSPDYHTPFNTELLWIYEGLTQYLMQNVAVRSGQVSKEYQREYLAHQVSSQLRRTGRHWRSLSDTSLSASTLKGSSNSWKDRLRGQDYYGEGALFWLSVDCLLREKSKGEVSLDDFCKVFFAPKEPESPPIEYQLDEVIETLNQLVEYNWEQLIRRRVYYPSAELAMDGIARSGYKLGWTRTKPKYIRSREEIMGTVQAIDSLGLSVSTRGDVLRVVPGSVADEAQLRVQSRVVAVNRRSFSAEVLNQELAAAAETGDEIEFIIRDKQWYSLHSLKYQDGPRHAVLERVKDSDNLLGRIYDPQQNATAGATD